jgi:hypothetical protein
VAISAFLTLHYLAIVRWSGLGNMITFHLNTHASSAFLGVVEELSLQNHPPSVEASISFNMSTVQSSISQRVRRASSLVPWPAIFKASCLDRKRDAHFAGQKPQHLVPSNLRCPQKSVAFDVEGDAQIVTQRIDNSRVTTCDSVHEGLSDQVGWTVSRRNQTSRRQFDRCPPLACR